MNWHEIVLNPNENFHLFFIQSNVVANNNNWSFEVSEVALENINPLLPSTMSITFSSEEQLIRCCPDIPETKKAFPLIWQAIQARQDMWQSVAVA